MALSITLVHQLGAAVLLVSLHCGCNTRDYRAHVGQLSMALLPVMGNRLAVLGNQLFDGRLWRHSPPVGVAAVRAAEDLVGMIMGGVSVGVLFAIVTRFVDSEERSSAAKPT